MYQRERANKRSVNDLDRIRLTASGRAATTASPLARNLIARGRGHRVHDRTRVLGV